MFNLSRVKKTNSMTELFKMLTDFRFWKNNSMLFSTAETFSNDLCKGVNIKKLFQ